VFCDLYVTVFYEVNLFVNILNIMINFLSAAVIQLRLPSVMNLLSVTCLLKKILALPRVNSISF
jgi:hypothetical protein